MIDVIWRPYQVECKKAIKENYDNGITKQLIVAGTGLGKRLMAVNLMIHFKRSLFIVHREELLMQAYDEVQKYFPMNVGIVKGPLFEIDKKVVIASVQTLYNRLDRMDPGMFDLVCIDECFPAGTKVNGVSIENYVKGCIVSSFNHTTNKVEWKRISQVIKRKYSGNLYDFGQFKCTPNHPIFIIGIGYCLAKEIHYAYLCSKVMRYGTNLQKHLHKLWFKFYSNKRKTYLFETMRIYKEIKESRSKTDPLFELWDSDYSGHDEKSNNIHEFSAKRFWLLFRKMQKRILFENRIENYEQYEQEILFRKNEEKQSNVQRGTVEQNESILNWTNFPKSWWKWSINKTPSYYCGVNPITNGISDISEKSNVTGKINASLTMLQSRSGVSGSKVSNRNRRKFSQIEALEVLRQTEDGHIEKSWLECIKIYKQTSRRKSTKDCKENYVYNLEVEGNNNYFANSILVHNCHHFCSKTWLKVARHWNSKLLTGWTATPKRLDGLSLTNLFDKMVFQYTLVDGIRDGFLAHIEAYQIKTVTDISKVKRTAGDFNQKQLSEVVDSALRNNLIVQKYKQYTPGMSAIAYCVDIEHAYHLRDEFRINGISCEAVSSDASRGDDRTETIKRFRNKEFQVLTNCEIAVEGFDFNDVGAILMTRPTQSETLYVQMLGRSTRLKSEAFITDFKTDKATILDFVDNTGKLNLINCYELEKDVPVEDRIFLPSEHKEKLLLEEKKRRERKIKLEEGRDRKVDLLKLPEVRVWDSVKMLEPATEKQLDWLRSAGVFAEDIEYTKMQASELISALPCQEWQIRYLAVNGYDVTHGASMGQYQRVKAYVDNKQKFAIKDQDKNKIINQLAKKQWDQ